MSAMKGQKGGSVAEWAVALCSWNGGNSQIVVNLLIWDCCHESQVYRNGYCFLRIRCADYMNHLRPRETFPFGHLAWMVFSVLLASKSRMFMSLYCGLSSRSSLGLPLCLSKTSSWCASVVSCLSCNRERLCRVPSELCYFCSQKGTLPAIQVSGLGSQYGLQYSHGC